MLIATKKAPLVWNDDDSYQRATEESIPFMVTEMATEECAESEEDQVEGAYNAYSQICNRSKIAKLLQTVHIAELVNLISADSSNGWLESSVMARSLL